MLQPFGVCTVTAGALQCSSQSRCSVRCSPHSWLAQQPCILEQLRARHAPHGENPLCKKPPGSIKKPISATKKPTTSGKPKPTGKTRKILAPDKKTKQPRVLKGAR